MIDSDRSALQSLLGALSVEQFLARYWERRSCLIRSATSPGLQARVRTLFSFDHADQILSVPGPRFRDFIRMSQGGHPIPRGEYSDLRQDGFVDFDVERVLELYAGGATITLNRAHQSSEALAALCVELAEALQAHVNANVYVTPPNSQGFAVHSDTHDVFLLQVEGRKKWKVQRHLQYLATPRNPNVTSDPVATVAWDEFYLEVGDAVYIPRGLLHEGVADDSHSLHVTVGVHPYTWADLVRDVLAEVEGTETLLRRSVAVPSVDADDAVETITARLEARLSDTEALASLLSARTGPYRAGSWRGRFDELTRPERIALTTPVRVRSGLDISVEVNHEDVILTAGTKSLAFPRYVSEHLRMVVESAEITAADLPADLDDAGKLTLVRRLLSEGVIEV